MKIPTLLYCLLVALNSFYQLPAEQALYPDGIKDNPITHPFDEMFVDLMVHPKSITGFNRVYGYVSESGYMLFLAYKENNKHVGLVIFRGGGLRNVELDMEGTDIALWLSKQGISCMVLA